MCQNNDIVIYPTRLLDVLSSAAGLSTTYPVSSYKSYWSICQTETCVLLFFVIIALAVESVCCFC